MTMAQAFNEWMRRYTENPQGFMAKFQSVERFKATAKGKQPDYGTDCARLLRKLMREKAPSKRSSRAR